jgi:hypothetical protein
MQGHIEGPQWQRLVGGWVTLGLGEELGMSEYGMDELR